MGISNVAVKTFDSSGAQSLCRTNEYKGDEEVKSSFISKCQKLYISGSGETVIPGSLRQFPGLNSTDTFYVNSDTDAISDMVFSIEFRFKNPDTTNITQKLIASVTKDIILSIIDRVEIKLGSLTVQTLTADDIYIRNLTELGVPYNFHSSIGQSLNYEGSSEITDITPLWQNLLDDAANHSDIHVIQASCSLPFIGRNKDMSRALLQAGALTNGVTVKVHYNRLYKNVTEVGGSSYQIITGGREDGTGFSVISDDYDYLDLNYFKSHLKVRTHIMTETEKKFISKNIIHKVLNTSSNVVKTIPRNLNVPRFTDTTTQIEVDLENISHNVSHLLIAVRLPHVHNRTLGGNTTFTNLPMDTTTINQFLGYIEASTPFGTINNLTFRKAGDLFGYLRSPIESMELVVGSDRTGFIKGSSAQLDTCENFDLRYNGLQRAFYIITLAEKAFDTAGVAFSKSNNKKLIIKLYDRIFSQLYTNNSLNSNDYEQSAIVTVTACGTKVQSVVGGSMSFL
jgi:phosphopantetheine adenylyltransferase